MTGGEQLDAWIKRQGLQKKFVASQLGVHSSTLTRWIKGEMPAPKAKHNMIEQFTEKHGEKLPREIWGQ